MHLQTQQEIVSKMIENLKREIISKDEQIAKLDIQAMEIENVRS